MARRAGGSANCCESGGAAYCPRAQTQIGARAVLSAVLYNSTLKATGVQGQRQKFGEPTQNVNGHKGPPFLPPTTPFFLFFFAAGPHQTILTMDDNQDEAGDVVDRLTSAVLERIQRQIGSPALNGAATQARANDLLLSMFATSEGTRPPPMVMGALATYRNQRMHVAPTEQPRRRTPASQVKLQIFQLLALVVSLIPSCTAWFADTGEHLQAQDRPREPQQIPYARLRPGPDRTHRPHRVRYGVGGRAWQVCAAGRRRQIFLGTAPGTAVVCVCEQGCI